MSERTPETGPLPHPRVVRDSPTANLSLRDPKIAMLRPDETPDEANTIEDIQRIHLAERIG